MFSHIPWGRKLIGSIVLANPLDACEASAGNFDSEKPFVLVKKGGCSYVTKVRNSEKYGASMVIIIDDAATGLMVMADDGFGFTVNIPSVVIGEQNGKILEQFIHS